VTLAWIAISLACGLCLLFGLLAGYAAGIAQTRKYHAQIFEDLLGRFEARIVQHQLEKAHWIEGLRESARGDKK
jgi:hypothetical protein